jgi:hypothetical protein
MHSLVAGEQVNEVDNLLILRKNVSGWTRIPNGTFIPNRIRKKQTAVQKQFVLAFFAAHVGLELAGI